MGREEALANIASALDRHQGRVAITAVHGLRGVGKTTLAAAFAELHRGDYRATWWIRAQNPESMRSDLISLGIRLGWVRPERGHEQELASIMERLRTDSEGLLLIYDNAIDATTLKPFLPTGGAAKILVTANTHVWRGLAEPIELGLWPKRIGADYLIARTGRRNERQAAETLSEFLGGLPLAHEQASAYCERLAVSMKDYTTRFTAEPYRLLDDAKHAPSEYNDGLTVARTFGLAIMEVAKLHAAALPLLTCLAQLPAHPIPLFLFSEGRVALEQPTLPFIDAEQLDHAVAALRSFALVEYESIPFVIWKDDEDIEEENPIAVVRLHRLVREVVLSRSERAVSEEARIPLMKAALKLYPYGREKFYFSGPHRNSDFLRYLIPSLVAEPIPNGQEGVAAQLIVKLVDNGDCSDPVPQLRRALSFAEAHFGPHHDQTAEILHYLAKQLITRQRPTKSRQETLRVIAEPLRLAQRALAIREQSDGFGNVLVPHSLELLDTMYTIMGRRDLAKECRDRAMKLLSGGVYF
jgi:hypothetical protein